nr:hypothetical protein [Bacteroidota bacterium]
MKTCSITFMIILFLLLNTSDAGAQYFWTPKHPLIPEQESSVNLCYYHGHFVWEHMIDSTTSAVYYNNIWSGSEPVCLAYEQNVKYSNPYFKYHYPNSWVFFEGNSGGNIDIFAIIVDIITGIPVGEMQVLIASPEDDHDFYYNIYGNGEMTWLGGDRVYYGKIQQISNQFSVTDIAILDSGNCSNPVLFHYCDLYWIKHLDTIDQVRFSQNGIWGWTTPVNIDTATQIRSLNASTDEAYPTVFWTFTDDSTWYMNDYFPCGSNSFAIIPDVAQNHPFDFEVSNIGMGVKNEADLGGPNFFQAYAKNTNGHSEIFLNSDGDPNIYYNFSEMDSDCRNPQFFMGESLYMGAFYFYLTWEAWIDNAWQVYYSKTQITWGGIEDNLVNRISNLIVSPNPFKNALEIQFDMEIPEHVVIDLIDNNGNLLVNLFSDKCSESTFIRRFNLPEMQTYIGICFIRFQIGESYSFQKVIKVI